MKDMSMSNKNELHKNFFNKCFLSNLLCMRLTIVAVLWTTPEVLFVRLLVS